MQEQKRNLFPKLIPSDEAGVQKFITDAKKITEESDKAVNRQILEMCFRELALSTELTEKS